MFQKEIYKATEKKLTPDLNGSEKYFLFGQSLGKVARKARENAQREK